MIQKFKVRSSPVTGDILSPRTPESSIFLVPRTLDSTPPFLSPSTPVRYLPSELLPEVEAVLVPAVPEVPVVPGVSVVPGVLELVVVPAVELEVLLVLLVLLELLDDGGGVLSFAM